MSTAALTLPRELLLQHGSPAWRAARCGIVTASRCGDLVVTRRDGEQSARRRHYREELIAEIFTGQPTQRFVSEEMQWGLDQEPHARAAYALCRQARVETAGFFLHPDLERFGASPDGLVGDNGLVQIKCPNTTTHLAWMMADVVPLQHAPQMLAELSCTGAQRQWNDFVSFDPRLPAHLQVFIKRMWRDEAMIALLDAEVIRFNDEIVDCVSSLEERCR